MRALRRPRVVVTGATGFVGQLLVPGLIEAGYDVDRFDIRRGPVMNLLRRRQFSGTGVAVPLQQAKKRLERQLVARTTVGLTTDDILAVRSVLAARFAGARSVVHLAAIPHPFQPGAAEADFRRINGEGAVNVFEAARDAGVGSFVFASSGQVYAINAPTPQQFPLLENDPVRTSGPGVTLYGLLKHEFERYLAAAATDDGGMVATALRLEFPGLQSRDPGNLFVSTSRENLVAGFIAAIEAPAAAGGETFNLCDGWIDLDVVDVQRHLAERFPGIPNHTVGNESLLSVDKARALLDFHPSRGGTYLDVRLM